MPARIPAIAEAAAMADKPLLPENTDSLPRRLVSQLPDLMQPQDYRETGTKKKIRLRLTITEQGIEILGDALHAAELEELLTAASRQRNPLPVLERTLCG
jgi:hypothetical protein